MTHNPAFGGEFASYRQVPRQATASLTDEALRHLQLDQALIGFRTYVVCTLAAASESMRSAAQTRSTISESAKPLNSKRRNWVTSSECRDPTECSGQQHPAWQLFETSDGRTPASASNPLDWRQPNTRTFCGVS